MATEPSKSSAPAARHSEMLTINGLPLELLVEISSYAPISARFLVLSFVCKRWRVAVLRSVRAFRSASWRRDDDGGNLPLALALFPHLVELRLKGPYEMDIALPSTLQRLELVNFMTWFEEDCFLEAHYPHLTDLKISAAYGRWNRPKQGLIEQCGPFFQAHCSQLTALSVWESRNYTLGALPTLHWPALRKLTIEGDREAETTLIVDHAPVLRELTATFTGVLPARCALCPPVARSSIDKPEDWSIKSTAEAAKASVSAAVITEVPFHLLPNLRSLALGDRYKPLPAACGFDLAKKVLRQSHGLRTLRVYSDCSDKEQLYELLELAASVLTRCQLSVYAQVLRCDFEMPSQVKMLNNLGWTSIHYTNLYTYNIPLK